MRTLSLLSLALVAALFLAGCATKPSAPPLSPGSVDYRDSREGFVITRPEGWRHDAPCCGMGALVLYPAEDTAVQIWVSRAYPEVPEEPSAREYFDSELEVSPSPDDYERLAIAHVEVNGIPSVKHAYTYTDPGGDTIRATDVLVKQGSRMFQVACSAPVGSFAAYLPTFEGVIHTFRMLER